MASSKDQLHDKPTHSSWDDSLPVPKLRFHQAAFIIFILAILCFYNSYDGDFVFDDSEAIINNNDLLSTTAITDIFANDFWGQKLTSKTSHKSYRPLTVLTFRLNYYLAGGLHPLGFHLINIILHAVVSVLFLQVCSVLFTGYLSLKKTEYFNSPRASFLCAVLFAVHPIHTESVAGVVGRADLLCALLFLLSFLSYARSCINEYSETSYRGDCIRIGWLLCCLFLCTLSTFCKEQGITVIGLCSAFDIIMVCRIDLLVLTGLRKSTNLVSNGNNNNVPKQDTFPQWLKCLVYRQISLAGTAVFLLVVRWRVMGSTPPTFQVHDNPHSFVEGPLYRALNYNYLYAVNVWLLLNPSWLCFDWSMGCIPVITSLSDVRILSALLFFIVLLTMIYLSLRNNTQHQRLLILCLVFLIVPFLPGSNLFFRVGFVVAERVLYLSSAGMCMLFTMGVVNISQKIKYKKILTVCLLLLVILYTARSMQRSAEWRNEMDLFEAGEKVCPKNAKVHYNIGKLHADKGNDTYAVERYSLAIKLNPDYDQAMNNLANILKEQGHTMEAEQLLLKAVKIRPEFAAAWMNLGIVQAQLNKNESSERSYLQALKHRRKYPDCFYNLGNLYLGLGRNIEALRAWRNATIIKPTHVNAWTNTLILLDTMGDFKTAVAVGKEVLKVLPREPQIQFNLANIYGKLEKYVESEQFFLNAIREEQNNSKFHLNLGVLYHRWGKYDKAINAYNSALKLDPNNPTIHENMAMLDRQKDNR
ncbi:hypothetical protein SNE40_001423 [Patella caerulea]|uniref:dolichyl-phosphate-mannose--protein mannosyltransferase n=1 Tax=Patella caerulea TaxID=87958 RepID=A0AAN8QI17_PATCE